LARSADLVPKKSLMDPGNIVLLFHGVGWQLDMIVPVISNLFNFQRCIFAGKCHLGHRTGRLRSEMKHRPLRTLWHTTRLMISKDERRPEHFPQCASDFQLRIPL
jgi:hypothetical protein